MYYNMYILIEGDHMDTITFTEFRSNLAKSMDNVSLQHEPLIVTRKQRARGSKPSTTIKAVLISLDFFNELNSYKETAYLLSTKANAKVLIKSIEQAEKGGTVSFDAKDWKRQIQNHLSKKNKKAA